MLTSTLPKQYRGLHSEVDDRSESGLESLCRVRLRQRGLRVRTQVPLAGLGRVDLLVGDRLIVETDGREWHEGSTAFLADRSRDLAAHRHGYLPLRLAARHVLHEWEWVERTIAAIVDRREHLWGGRHGANPGIGG